MQSPSYHKRNPVPHYDTSYTVSASYKYNTMIRTCGDPMIHLLHRSYLNLDLEHKMYNHRIHNQFYLHNIHSKNILLTLQHR